MRHPGRTVIHRAIDLRDCDEAADRFDRLGTELGGVELVVISSGVGPENPLLDWSPEAETVAVNVAGFTAIAVAAMRHFEADGPGTSSAFPRWRLVVWLLRIFPDTS